MIGGGFLLRQGARQLVGLIPVAGIVPKVAVAYAGTLAIGKAVVAWATYGTALIAAPSRSSTGRRSHAARTWRGRSSWRRGSVRLAAGGSIPGAGDRRPLLQNPGHVGPDTSGSCRSSRSRSCFHSFEHPGDDVEFSGKVRMRRVSR